MLHPSDLTHTLPESPIQLVPTAGTVFSDASHSAAQQLASAEPYPHVVFGAGMWLGGPYLCLLAHLAPNGTAESSPLSGLLKLYSWRNLTYINFIATNQRGWRDGSAFECLLCNHKECSLDRSTHVPSQASCAHL